MPRFDVNRIFLLLKLVYFDFILYFITVIIKNTQFVLMHCLKPLITFCVNALLKTFDNIANDYNNLPKVRIWAKRDFQKTGENFK